MKEGGAARTRWQSRWFRLQGKTINYFVKREDTNPQGVIHLDEVKDVSKIGERSGKPHCLSMVIAKDKGKKVYYLSAETDESINEWFVAFQANLAPDVPMKLVKYSTVEVFLTQGIRILGDVSYDILSHISHRIPVEKKKRDNLGWFCDRPIAVGMVLNLFSQYGWSADHIYRSTGVSGTDPNTVHPVIRIIFSKSPQDEPSTRSRLLSKGGPSPQSSPHPTSGSRFEGSGKFMGAILGKLSSSLAGGKGEETSPAGPTQSPSVHPFSPDVPLLEGADDELISLMEEFDIPLSLLELTAE